MDRLSNSVIGKLYRELSLTSVAIFLFFILSMSMQWTISKFEKESFFSSLQFGFNPEEAAFIQERKVLFGNFEYETWFFIPDIFFMLSICWLVSIFYKKTKRSREKKYINYTFFKWALIIIGILSVIFDWYENFQYLGGVEVVPFYWSAVTAWKSSAIALFIALSIVYFILHFSDNGIQNFVIQDSENSLNWQPRKLLIVIRGSAISILVLIVIGLGLTLLDQGATLVVHLLEQANEWPGFVQIVMTVLLINFLAVIISHYPEYFQNAIDPSKKTRWHINWVFNKIPGLITFTNIHYGDHAPQKRNDQANTLNEDKSVSKYANYVTLFRYYLGVMTYVAWFYVMYKAFDLYSLSNFDAGSSVFLWSVFVSVIIYYLYRAHSRDADDITREIVRLLKLDPNIEQEARISKKSIDRVRPWVNGYELFMILTLVVGIVAMIVFAKYGWHVYSFYVTIIYLLTNTLFYIFFRFTRLYIKFVWFQSSFVINLLKKDREYVFNDASKVSLVLENNTSRNFLKRFVGKTSSNYYFLYYMRIIATISSMYLAWSFFTMDSYITDFSAIPLTLSF